MSLILFAIPFFFILIGIEYLYARSRKKEYYRFNDTITNITIGIGNQAFNLFFKTVLLGMYILVFENLALFTLPETWWVWLIALIGQDFLFYWAHRWGHTVNFFWGAHVVHHQSEEYNLSVALRQSWLHNALAFFIFLPLPLFGIPPLTFVAAVGVQTLYQFWIHTRAIKKMPAWIEYIFNTPSHHRVHHGINPKYIDRNHGGMFIIWDRMFGTFQVEEEEPVYGITTQLKSWNPVWANWHYYQEIIESALKMESWWDRLRMIFAKPGWRPQELGGTIPLSEPDPDRKSYNASAKPIFNFYIVLQFAFIVGGLVAFMGHFEEISTFYRWVFFGILVLSSGIIGAIFEQKKWVIIAEYIRLILVMTSLNTFYYFWYQDWMVWMVLGSSIGFIISNVWFSLGWLLNRTSMTA